MGDTDENLFELPRFDYSDDALINGSNPDNVTFRPLDAGNRSEAFLLEAYNELWSAIANNVNIGVRRHYFFGYDIQVLLTVLQYVWLVNYFDEYDSDEGAEIDYACQEFLSELPTTTGDGIDGIPSGQSHSPSTDRAPLQYEGWYAPVVWGDTPALSHYLTLRNNMRQTGPRPSGLADRSFDELLISLAKIERYRRLISLGTSAPSAFEFAGGTYVVTRLLSNANPASLGRIRAAGGAATVLIAGADFGLMIAEQELEEEIQRRLDHDPDDQVDPNFLQSRTRELGVSVDLPNL